MIGLMLTDWLDDFEPKEAASSVPHRLVTYTRTGILDWMAGAPRVSRYRRELAEAIREQASSGRDVYLGPSDAALAADALDGFSDLDNE